MTVSGTNVRTGVLARMDWSPTPASAQRPGQVSHQSHVHGTNGPEVQPLASLPLRVPTSIPGPLSTLLQAGIALKM